MFKFPKWITPASFYKSISNPIRDNYIQDIELDVSGKRFNSILKIDPETPTTDIRAEIQKLQPATIAEQLAYTDFATELYYGDTTADDDLPKDENSKYRLANDAKKYVSRVKQWHSDRQKEQDEKDTNKDTLVSAENDNTFTRGTSA